MRNPSQKTVSVQGRQTGLEQKKYVDRDTTINLVEQHVDLLETGQNTRTKDFMSSAKKSNAFGIFLLENRKNFIRKKS